MDVSKGDNEFGDFAETMINSRDPCDNSQIDDVASIALQAEQSLVIRMDAKPLTMVAEISFLVICITTCIIVCAILMSKHRSNPMAKCCCCISSDDSFFHTSLEDGVRLERRDAVKHCIFVSILLGSTNSFNTTIISGVSVPIMNQFYGCSNSKASITLRDFWLPASCLAASLAHSLLRTLQTNSADQMQ